MTRDPQRRDSSSESVSTPSMSKRMAVTGGAAEAAKAEEGTAAVPVEVGRVGVGRCREKRFCRGACADAEPLLPAAVPPPRPVVLLFLRPIHLTVSPNIHAPVMSSFFELKKSGGVKRNQKICAHSPSLFFSLVAASSSPCSFPSLCVLSRWLPRCVQLFRSFAARPQRAASTSSSSSASKLLTGSPL